MTRQVHMHLTVGGLVLYLSIRSFNAYGFTSPCVVLFYYFNYFIMGKW